MHGTLEREVLLRGHKNIAQRGPVLNELLLVGLRFDLTPQAMIELYKINR